MSFDERWPMQRLHTLFVSVFALLSLSGFSLWAQASRTASKSADISVFGGFEAANPDYGPYRSYGGTFGADFTRYIALPFEPSLEFRANLHSNQAISEHSYDVGLRIAAPFARVKPYADFLVGPGYIHFLGVIGYTHDDSIVYSYGGGLDLRVTRNFAARFDLQGQHWNTGQNTTYTPTIGTVGIVYTIPFRPHVRQRDLGR